MFRVNYITNSRGDHIGCRKRESCALPSLVLSSSPPRRYGGNKRLPVQGREANQGDFIWHDHNDTDETFIVIDGVLRIDFSRRRGPCVGGRDVRRSAVTITPRPHAEAGTRVSPGLLGGRLLATRCWPRPQNGQACVRSRSCRRRLPKQSRNPNLWPSPAPPPRPECMECSPARCSADTVGRFATPWPKAFRATKSS